MALKTPEQYIDSITKLKPRLFIAGKRVENIASHRNIEPLINAVAKTYELAMDPEYQELATATSHLTGEKVSRWNHVQQSIDDLHKRCMLNIAMAQKIGCCHYRCSGQEGMHVLASVTYAMDQKLGTEYNKRFNNFLSYMQENDLTANALQTDGKGDRSKRPLEQEDLDLYLHVVEKRDDGIVVRGAKLHQVGGMLAHEHIVFPPLIPLGKGEEDYAVSFVIPNGTEGVTYICQSGPIEVERREAESVRELGIPEYGSELTTMIVFDNVFVPWERVFMCGEVEFTPYMLDKFVRVHNVLCRGSCKVGNMDLLIGAAQTIAEYNGIANSAHVRDKITEMIRVRETTHACTTAAVQNGNEDPPSSGVYFPDSMFGLMTSLNTQYGFPQAALLAADLAGGSVVTMPSERELQNPETSRYVKQYLKGVASVPTEHRMRMLKFLQHWTAGPQAVLMWHSSGPLQVNRTLVYREALAGLEGKKKLAKELAGIKE
jgi:4-hydroxybutyryl-CoA dehydratase/vinylacetyl-CoA-Delta-isomerase